MRNLEINEEELKKNLYINKEIKTKKIQKLFKNLIEEKDPYYEIYNVIKPYINKDFVYYIVKPIANKIINELSIDTDLEIRSKLEKKEKITWKIRLGNKKIKDMNIIEKNIIPIVGNEIKKISIYQTIKDICLGNYKEGFKEAIRRINKEMERELEEEELIQIILLSLFGKNSKKIYNKKSDNE